MSAADSRVLTLAELLDDLGLPLIGPREAAQRPLRWVHISELPDPTPWLSGGELLLTTGMQLGSAKRQRDFVERLAGAEVAGLGLGTGFAHAEPPPELVAAAAGHGLPLFEVPYELPFIAITERASARLVSDHYELLRRSIAAHERLEALVLERKGLDTVVAAVSSLTTAAVAVLDPRGELVAGEPSAAEGAGSNGRTLVLPIAQPRAPARLTATKRSGELTEFDRLILHHAQTIVALELLNRRVAADTERRLAGNVLAAVVTGELAGADLEHRLAPFAIGSRAACLVFAPPHAGGQANGNGRPSSGGLGPELVAALEAEGAAALVAERGRMLCALVAAGDEEDVFALAERARQALAGAAGEKGVRAGAGRPVATGEVRRSFHEARCALEASALAGGENGAEPRTATYRDLGSFQLLLSLQDTEALRLFCDSVLGPVEAADRGYGDELLRSLEVFIEENGQWERAAKRLYCHRHTLRYRVRRIETLTGRELSRAQDRIEFWLALRGRELL